MIHLDVLPIMQLMHAKNGLKHSDFQRYRRAVTSTLSKTRKLCKRANKGKNFTVRDRQIGVTDFIKSSTDGEDATTVPEETQTQMLMIILLQSERAWAYGMGLKTDQTDESNTRKRFHVLTRFKKASMYANQLSDICSAVADNLTQLQVDAYKSFIIGTLEMEKENHKKALKEFHLAEAVFNQLKTLNDDVLNNTCDERLAQLQPLIRYCRYVIQRQGDDIDSSSHHAETKAALESKVALARQDQSKHSSNNTKFEGVVWKKEIIQVTSIKLQSLLQKTIDLQQQEQEEEEQEDLEQSIITAYDDILIFVKGVIKESKVESSQIATYDLVKEYATYHKITRFLKRNLSLFKSMKQQLNTSSASSEEIKSSSSNTKSRKIGPENMVLICDKLISSLDTLCEVSDDKTSLQTMSAQKTAFKSQRCYYLANAYAKVSEWSISLSLFKRCQKLADISMNSKHLSEDIITELKEISSQAQVEAVVIRAKSLLKDKQEPIHNEKKNQNNTSSSKQFLDRLDVFDAGNEKEHYNLVSYPPKFASVPSKPILFDLAWNEVEFNVQSLQARVDEQKGLWGRMKSSLW